MIGKIIFAGGPMATNGRSQSSIKSFRDLYVWKESQLLTLEIFRLTAGFEAEAAGLGLQLRHAALSLMSRVAEGFGHRDANTRLEYYYLAHGSVIKLINTTVIAKELGYLKPAQSSGLEEQTDKTYRLLWGLIHKSKTYAANRQEAKYQT